MSMELLIPTDLEIMMEDISDLINLPCSLQLFMEFEVVIQITKWISISIKGEEKTPPSCSTSIIGLAAAAAALSTDETAGY